MRAPLILIGLLLASCSYPEEEADITVQVDGIPQAADHLVVTLTPGVPPKTFHPTFQPVQPTAGLRSMELAFTQPAATGTFTVKIDAKDRIDTLLATGTVTGTLPGPVSRQVTLQ
jgi:hypothetical protein